MIGVGAVISNSIPSTALISTRLIACDTPKNQSLVVWKYRPWSLQCWAQGYQWHCSEVPHCHLQLLDWDTAVMFPSFDLLIILANDWQEIRIVLQNTTWLPFWKKLKISWQCPLIAHLSLFLGMWHWRCLDDINLLLVTTSLKYLLNKAHFKISIKAQLNFPQE